MPNAKLFITFYFLVCIAVALQFGHPLAVLPLALMLSFLLLPTLFIIVPLVRFFGIYLHIYISLDFLTNF
jgi:hypothetical protein